MYRLRSFHVSNAGRAIAPDGSRGMTKTDTSLKAIVDEYFIIECFAIFVVDSRY